MFAVDVAESRNSLKSGRLMTRVLSKELLDLMKQPTVDMRGSALGDYVGISWLMRDVEGVRLVGHGGSMNGQYSEFVTVPERGFALASLTNSGPNGPQFNDEILKWALASYLGVVEKDPEPISLGDNELAAYAGKFTGKYAHRLITGGIGHNLPQEAPQAFAHAVLNAAAM